MTYLLDLLARLTDRQCTPTGRSCGGEGACGGNPAPEAGTAAASGRGDICAGQLAWGHPAAGPGCHPQLDRAAAQAAQAGGRLSGAALTPSSTLTTFVTAYSTVRTEHVDMHAMHKDLVD